MTGSQRPTMPDMPQVAEPDIVLRLLMGFHLVDHESDFRAILENIAESPDAPKIRDLVVATVAILMTLGGVGWPVVMRVMSNLRRLPDEELQQGAVAIMNGSHLMLPGPGDQVRILDLATLRETEGDPPPAFVSTIYSMTAIWEQTLHVLS